MKYRYISYPRDVTQDMANGHYMLFYVNVQNKAGYGYDAADGSSVGAVVEQREYRQGNPHSDFDTAGSPATLVANFIMLNKSLTLLVIKMHLIELQKAEKETV